MGDVTSMKRVAQLAERSSYPPLTNIRGMWESTPLIYACQYSHPIAAMWLLEHGADVHLQNEKGVTPLLLASLEGMTDVVDWILASPTRSGATDVVVHVDKQVGVVYNASADVNARVNPLLAASMNGHVAIVATLLARGANVNVAVPASSAVGAAKQFALLLAAKFGHASVVRLLIKHGADFATSDASGNHALLLACEASHEACAMELLQLLPSERASAYVACWKQPNGHGLTALHFAAANGLLAVVQYMLVQLAWGGDRAFVDATSVSRRECALLMACRKRQSEVVQLLVRCGADFELPDRGGTTALQVLAREKKDTLVQLCESTRAASRAGDSAAETTEGSGGGANDTTALVVDIVAIVGEQHDEDGVTATGGFVEGRGAKQVVTAANFDWDADVVTRDGEAPPQTLSSVVDRLAAVVGGAFRSMSFSRTQTSGGLKEQQERQQQEQQQHEQSVLRALDEASTHAATTVAPTATEQNGMEGETTVAPVPDPSLQATRGETASLTDAAANRAEDAREASRHCVDTTRGVETTAEAARNDSRDATAMALAPEPALVVVSESEANVTATVRAAALTASPSKSADAPPGRKPSKPKHHKKEQTSPPKRPRQKKSVANDTRAVALAAGVEAVVVFNDPPSSSSGEVAERVDDRLGDSHDGHDNGHDGHDERLASVSPLPVRETRERSTASEPRATDDRTDIAAQDVVRELVVVEASSWRVEPSALGGTDDSAAEWGDALATKKERRKKKSQSHVSTKSKHDSRRSRSSDTVDDKEEQVGPTGVEAHVTEDENDS